MRWLSYWRQHRGVCIILYTHMFICVLFQFPYSLVQREQRLTCSRINNIYFNNRKSTGDQHSMFINDCFFFYSVQLQCSFQLLLPVNCTKAFETCSKDIHVLHSEPIIFLFFQSRLCQENVMNFTLLYIGSGSLFSQV